MTRLTGPFRPLASVCRTHIPKSFTLPLFCLLLAICLAGCEPTASRGESSSSVQNGSSSRHSETNVKQAMKIEFISFTAKWCAVCNKVPPVVADLRKEFPSATFRDLDVDDQENFKLYVKYIGDGEPGVPFFFVLIDGEVVASQRGILPYVLMAKFLRDAITQHASVRS